MEAEGLRWLFKLAPEGTISTITPLLFEDRDHHIIGMAAVAWPHENWKSLLLQGRIDEQHVLSRRVLLFVRTTPAERGDGGSISCLGQGMADREYRGRAGGGRLG